MNEGKRSARTEDVDPDELGSRLRRPRLVQVGQRSGMTRIGIVAQDRCGARQPSCIRRKPDQPQRNCSRDGVSLQLSHPLDVCRRRRQPLARERVQEFSQEKRVTTALLMTGDTEAVLGFGGEDLSDDMAGGPFRQRGRPDDRRQGIRQDLSQGERVRPWLRRAKPNDEGKRKVLDARSQVGEPSERGWIAPVQIIDREEERSLRRDVHRQPVEAVERCQRSIRGGLGRELCWVEERRREHGCAGEQLGLLLRGQPA
jgi:hypothetical protein